MKSDILVVGSLAYDSISTPAGAVAKTLGGSANYFSLAASNFAKVALVGVVGEDYDKNDMKLLESRSVDLRGMQQVKGKTFHWEGEYKDDMNEAITRKTELNVFGDFNPQLIEDYKHIPYVFLANIDPELQLRVLDQVQKPKLVASDTMNFWISSKLPALKKVLERVDLLLINEGEAKALSKTSNAIAAAEEISKMGPKAVAIKRGEYGFVLYFEKEFFILPAFPVSKVVDPTGAGDSFAGGVLGYLAKTGKGLDAQTLREACVHGCIVASFTVQDFGVKAVQQMNLAALDQRLSQFRKIVTHN